MVAGHSLRTMVLTGLAALIVLTAAGAAVIYHGIIVTRRSGEEIARSIEIRAAGERLVNVINGALSGERGFLVTGNERFLDAYTDSPTTVRHTATQLYALLDDRVQVARVHSIQSLFERWSDQVAQRDIAARRAAPSGYAAASRGAAGEAMRLREAVAAYAVSGGGESLRAIRLQAAMIRDHLTAIMRMAPPSMVSTDAAQAVASVDLIAGAGPNPSAASLLQAASSIEATTRRRALAAEAAESTVMTLITVGDAQTAGEAIRRQYAVFATAEVANLDAQLAAARAATGQAEAAALAIPIAVVALLLIGLYHATGVTGAIDGMIRASHGLAAGDLTHRVSVQRADEIGQLAAAFNDMADQIAIRDRRSGLVRSMSEMLEASGSVEEAQGVVSRYVEEMFPGSFGGVYLIRESRDLAEMVASWGADRAHPLPTGFAPEECWALRRAQVHVVDARRGGMPCRHTPTPPPAAALCLALTAQGDTLGILTIALPGTVDGRAAPAPIEVSDATVALARAAADRAALAIANLRLRERLRDQSVRDPLTGVFNRRYLDETLEREIRRAQRTNRPLGLMMFDIDGFKQFNDTLGHEAGYEYLRELGVLLRERFRRGDVVCRYGGDEFVIVLPEGTLVGTLQRAQTLGQAVEGLEVTYDGRPMGTATLSLGVAAFPEHGSTGEALLRSADAALYRAKQNGRARAELATSPG